MKFLKKKSVAVVIMVLAIVVAIGIGAAKAPVGSDLPDEGHFDTGLDSGYFRRYIADNAGVLSEDAEEMLSLYNANWDEMMGSIIGVITVEGIVSAGIDDMALEMGSDLGLGENDAVLFMNVTSGEYTLLAYGWMYDLFSQQPASFVDNQLYAGVAAGDYEGAVLNLFSTFHPIVDDEWGSGWNEDDGGFFSVGFGTIFTILMLVLVLVIIFTVIDGIRYSSWNARYGTVRTPPVIYRPILWWHRPGSSWYRRRRNPPPPKPPRGGGGPRPPMGGRPPRSSGSSRPWGSSSGGRGSSRPSRGGSFGGGSRGSFGGSRGGSFGGSRGGSFGGSRGGSFGGGRRGGGFGGRR